MARLIVPKEDVVIQHQGVETRLSRDYTQLEHLSVKLIRELLVPYPKAMRFFNALVRDPEVLADWDMADYLAVSKLHYNDHGEVHHKVVASAAASILQLLIEANVQPDVVASGAGDLDDAFLVVLGGALLHDIGNQVHRTAHPTMSVILAIPLLNRLLEDIYPEQEKRFELRAFILHSIVAHDADVAPLTIEAAVVSVADACDMSKGRSRYSFDSGTISIHSVGGLSVERVLIERGQKKPVRVRVELSNSAGIFPVEQYLVPKITAGNMEQYIEVAVLAEPEDSHTDRRILYSVEMQGKRFVAYESK